MSIQWSNLSLPSEGGVEGSGRLVPVQSELQGWEDDVLSEALLRSTALPPLQHGGLNDTKGSKKSIVHPSRSSSRAEAAAVMALKRLQKRAHTSLGCEVRSQANSFTESTWITAVTSPKRNTLAMSVGGEGGVPPQDVTCVKEVDLFHSVKDCTSADIVALHHVLSSSKKTLERVVVPHITDPFIRKKFSNLLIEAAPLCRNLISVEDPSESLPNDVFLQLHEIALNNQRRKQAAHDKKESQKLKFESSLRVQQANEELECFLHWENSNRLATYEAYHQWLGATIKGFKIGCSQADFKYRQRLQGTRLKAEIEIEENKTRGILWHDFIHDLYKTRMKFIDISEDKARRYVEAEKVHVWECIAIDKSRDHMLAVIHTNQRIQRIRKERLNVNDEEVIARRKIEIGSRIRYIMYAMQKKANGKVVATKKAMQNITHQSPTPSSHHTPQPQHHSHSSPGGTVLVPPPMTPPLTMAPSTPSNAGSPVPQYSLVAQRKHNKNIQQQRTVIEATETLERDTIVTFQQKVATQFHNLALMMHAFFRSLLQHQILFQRALKNCERTMSIDPRFAYRQFCMVSLEFNSSTFIFEGLKLELHVEESLKKDIEENWGTCRDNNNALNAQIFDFNTQQSYMEKSLQEIITSRVGKTVGLDTTAYRIAPFSMPRFTLPAPDQFISRKLQIQSIRLNVKPLLKSPFDASRFYVEPNNANAHDSFSIVLPPNTMWSTADGHRGKFGGVVSFERNVDVVITFMEPLHIDVATETLRTLKYMNNDKSAAVYCRCMRTRIQLSPDLHVACDDASWDGGVFAETAITVVRWPPYIDPEIKSTIKIHEYTPVAESKLLGSKVKVAMPAVVERENGYCGVLIPTFSSGSNVLRTYYTAIFLTFTDGYTVQDQILFEETNHWSLHWDRISQQEIRYKDECVAKVVKGYMWRPNWCNQMLTKGLTQINDEIIIEFTKPMNSAEMCGELLARFGMCNYSPIPTPGVRSITVTLRDSLGNVGSYASHIDVTYIDIPAKLTIDELSVVYRSVSCHEKSKKHIVPGVSILRNAKFEDLDTQDFLNAHLRCRILDGHRGILFLRENEDIIIREPTKEILYKGTCIGTLVKGQNCKGSSADVSKLQKEKEIDIRFDRQVLLKDAQHILGCVVYYTVAGTSNSSANPMSPNRGGVTSPFPTPSSPRASTKIEIEFNSGTPVTKVDCEGNPVRTVKPEDTTPNIITMALVSITMAEAVILCSHPGNAMAVKVSGKHSLGIDASRWMTPTTGPIRIHVDVREGAEIQTDTVFPFSDRFDVEPPIGRAVSYANSSDFMMDTMVEENVFCFRGRPHAKVFRDSDDKFLKSLCERDIELGVVPYCVQGELGSVQLSRFNDVIARVSTTGPSTTIDVVQHSEASRILESLSIVFLSEAVAVKVKTVVVTVFDRSGGHQVILNVTREGSSETRWPFINTLFNTVYHRNCPLQTTTCIPTGTAALYSRVPKTVSNSLSLLVVLSDGAEDGDKLIVFNEETASTSQIISIASELPNFNTFVSQSNLPNPKAAFTPLTFEPKGNKVMYDTKVVANADRLGSNQITFTVKDSVIIEGFFTKDKILQLIGMIAFQTTSKKRTTRTLSLTATFDGKVYESVVSICVEGPCFELKSKVESWPLICGLVWKPSTDIMSFDLVSVGEKVSFNCQDTDLLEGSLEVTARPQSGTLQFDPDDEVKIQAGIVYVDVETVASVEEMTPHKMKFKFTNHVTTGRVKSILRQILFSAEWQTRAEHSTSTEAVMTYLTKQDCVLEKTFSFQIRIVDAVGLETEGEQFICYCEEPERKIERRGSVVLDRRRSSVIRRKSSAQSVNNK